MAVPASLRVRSKLEALLKDQGPRIPIAAVMLSASAQHAVAVIVPSGYRAGPLDVFRRLGLAAIDREWLSDLAKAFWTTDAVAGLRQPEPGCSDPTFVASHADVAGLSARAPQRDRAVARRGPRDRQRFPYFPIARSP